jgi:hypothetical protein
MDTINDQKEYIEDLASGITEQLDEAGLSCVNTYVAEKLETVKDEHTDTQVTNHACTATTAPEGRVREATLRLQVASDDGVMMSMACKEMKRSYGAVINLLEKAEPAGLPWDKKIRDLKRCGLVKAVNARGECEWVHPKHKPAFECGRAQIGGSGNAQQSSEASMKVLIAPKCPVLAVNILYLERALSCAHDRLAFKSFWSNSHMMPTTCHRIPSVRRSKSTFRLLRASSCRIKSGLHCSSMKSKTRCKNRLPSLAESATENLIVRVLLPVLTGDFDSIDHGFSPLSRTARLRRPRYDDGGTSSQARHAQASPFEIAQRIRLQALL